MNTQPLTQFIYCPKSGDRVFAENSSITTAVCWVRWSNGCRHIFGGQLLTYQAANAGEHWRASATRMATVLVGRFGGIAWDSQGEVSLVIPGEAALECHRYMNAARQASSVTATESPDRNEVAMLLNGWNPAAMTLAPSWCGDFMYAVGINLVPHELRTDVFVTWLDSEGGRHKHLSAVAPSAWGTPAVSHSSMLRMQEVVTEAAPF